MSFFKNLFNEATKFVEEHSKTLEKTFDEIKGELGAKFNEALLAEQNGGKIPEIKVFRQVFDDNQAIIKFETPNGEVILSKNQPHCKSEFSSERIDSHYDIVNNALQVLNITYENNTISQVSHKICAFSNIKITDAGWDYPRLHTDLLGVVTVYTHESVPTYNYKIDSEKVERVYYDYSSDIGLYTDKDPRNSFKIVEDLILPNVSAEMQAFYNSETAKAERENQIGQKMAIINVQKAEQEAKEKYQQTMLALQNRDFALMQEYSLKPLEGIKESIAKNGLPKEKSFVTKKGETIYFDGELIFWKPAQDGKRGKAMYFEIIKNENDKKILSLISVEYDEDGEIRYVQSEKAPFEYVICKPHDQDYSNFCFEEDYQNYRFVLFGTWGATLQYCYSVKADNNDRSYTNESVNLFFALHSLEDIYALAGRIFFGLSEENKPQYAQFLSEVIAGIFVKRDFRIDDDEDNSYQEQENNDYVDNSSSSNSSHSSKKENKKEEKTSNNSASTKKELVDIKIKNDQKNGSVTIYNQNRGGSYNIQRGITTTIKCYVGDKLFDYEGQKKGRLLFVVEENMDGKVQLFTKF